MNIKTNSGAKAGIYTVTVVVRASMGTQVTQKNVTYKIQIHEKEKTITAPIEPVVTPIIEPVVEPIMEPIMEPIAEPTPEPLMPMEPIVVVEPTPIEMPVMEPIAEPMPMVMEPIVIPEIKPDEFIAEVTPTEDGTSVAIDFEEAAGASLDGQNPEDLSLNVEVSDPAGEIEMAQVTPAQLDVIMEAPMMEMAPAMEMPSMDPMAAMEPAMEMGMNEMSMDVVEPMPMESSMPAMDLDAMMGFRRRRLAAVGVKKADVYYAAVIKSSKGAKFAVDLKFSDPLAVKNAKVNFTLSGKNGFKANMGVALPKQFASGTAAKTSAMFTNIICYMFGFNMLLTVVFWTYGWSLYNTMQLIATFSVLGMPMAPNVDQVLMGVWNLMNLNSIFQVKVFGRAPVSDLA